MLGYYAVLDRLHGRRRPRTYLEIGVHTGESLALARPRTRAVGVDPALPGCLERDVHASLHACTSDEFFATADVAGELGGPIELAFVDGLHLFEQALRDVANVERHAAPDGMILLHDCLPIDAETSSRERTTVAWSGDVWKVVWCLRAARPDLHVVTLDVGPTGLGVITNLDPGSRVLDERHEELVAHHLPLGYDDLVAPGVRESLGVVDVAQLDGYFRQ